MTTYEHILQAIGKTPLVRLNRISENIASSMYCKVEYLNPGGSTKDRIALVMIEAAEKSGQLPPGGTIIEATAGNTGVGLALIAAVKKYRCIFVMPDKMSQDKINLLKAYGAEVVVTPTSVAPDSPESYNGVAERLAKEIPGAYLLKIIDILALANVARQNHLILVVDNTFASPYFQKPLDLGADIVVHSTTKYLGGHSDVIGGAVVTSNPQLYSELKFYQNAIGAVPSPFDSWLVLRGIKTLAVRMREHEKNALYLAEFLAQHPKVERIYYPGLSSHEQYQLAQEQMSGFGGMISLELKGGFAEVERFASRLQLFLLAESLGGVESLLCYPAKMTHGSLPEAERLKRGIKDNLVRLSVGIEHQLDLQADLETALSS